VLKLTSSKRRLLNGLKNLNGESEHQLLRRIQLTKNFHRIYYQYDSERLSTCVLTIHGLLHLCDNIRFCGPVWATWTFWMERYCGYLQASLKSKISPWADLNSRILHKAYLDQIYIFYDLNTGNSQVDQLSRGERIFPTCELIIPLLRLLN
jgi:hypothetical protein